VIEPHRRLEKRSGFGKIAVIELMLSGDEISSGRGFNVSRFFEGVERIGIDLAIPDYFADEGGVILQIADGGERWQIARIFVRGRASGRRRHGASCLDSVDRGFRNRVGVVADIVLDASAVFSDVIGPDGATILEVNDLSRCAVDRGPREY